MVRISQYVRDRPQAPKGALLLNKGLYLFQMITGCKNQVKIINILTESTYSDIRASAFGNLLYIISLRCGFV